MKELRKEFVEAASQTSNFSSLCREFGVTRKTGYKWLERARELDDLSDKSHARKTVSNKTAPDIESIILSVRADNPGWGGKTIRQVLLNQGYTDLPCEKTVCNILKRNGCISEEESLKHKPFIRFEKDLCNEMWQADFKGEFLMTDNNYCYPLDIIDDHSRFCIRLTPHLSTANVTISTFRGAFCEYGVPKSILTDNGSQFAGFKHGYTQFEKWLMNHDVLPIHGRIKHPQTQGKIERFHRSMKQELLNHKTFYNIDHAREELDAWRLKYNNIRPHEALGMRCPADVYLPADRTYKDRISKPDYGGQYHVIKVNTWGYVRFDKWQLYLSETMINEYVEFRPNPHGDSFFVCYRNFKIAEFSADTGERLNRNISRL